MTFSASKGEYTADDELIRKITEKEELTQEEIELVKQKVSTAPIFKEKLNTELTIIGVLLAQLQPEEDERIILKYLDGNLENYEKDYFDKRMEDPYFSELLDTYIEERKIIKEVNKNENGNNADGYRGNAKAIFLLPIMRYAAAIILLLMVFFTVQYINADFKSSETVFNDNFHYTDFISPYESSLSVKKEVENEISNDSILVEKMEIYYDNRDIKAGIQSFESIASNDLKDEIKVYAGVLYLASNNLSKAKEIFDSLISDTKDNKSNESYYFAQWYSALLLIKEGKIESAKELLYKLKANNPFDIMSKRIDSLILQLEEL